MSKIIFLDIDGCIVKHHGGSSSTLQTHPTVILPNVLEKLDEWEVNGYQIIITTGRKESLRKFTEKQLTKYGIVYDQLIMGLGRGERIIVNDESSNGELRASAVSIKRNDGIGQINI